MADAECTKTYEKPIFQFLLFLFLRYGRFLYSKLVSFSMNFEYKIDHNSKNRNCKYLKIDFSFVLAHYSSFLQI